MEEICLEKCGCVFVGRMGRISVGWGWSLWTCNIQQLSISYSAEYWKHITLHFRVCSYISAEKLLKILCYFTKQNTVHTPQVLSYFRYPKQSLTSSSWQLSSIVASIHSFMELTTIRTSKQWGAGGQLGQGLSDRSGLSGKASGGWMPWVM